MKQKKLTRKRLIEAIQNNEVSTHDNTMYVNEATIFSLAVEDGKIKGSGPIVFHVVIDGIKYELYTDDYHFAFKNFRITKID